MKITLKQLKIFSAIARSKQVTLAAEQCFISQSAASMALAQLEIHLQGKLFTREGKQLFLNEYGEKLLPKAIDILDRVEELEQTTVSGELRGKIKIGASRTIGAYILPKMINRFSKTYPEVKIDLHCCNTEEVIKMLEQAEIDVGFIEGLCKIPAIESYTFAKDRLVVFSRAQHPLSKKKQLTLKDLKNYPWILRELGSGTREMLISKFYKNNINIDVLMEMNNAEAIKEIVQNSDALACLGEEIIAQEIKAKKIVAVNIPGLNLERNLSVILLQDRYRSKLSTTFLESITE